MATMPARLLLRQSYCPQNLRHYASAPPRPRNSPRLGQTLDLEQFIRRSKVLALYRSFVRTASKIQDTKTRTETLKYFRDEFESNKHVTDPGQIQHLIQMGRATLGSIERSVNQAA
ncbi:hypothetical protein RB601_009274 [Gaeumannomyces tritici]